MADQKISQLPSGAPAALADPLPTAKAGATKSLTVQDVLTAQGLLASGAPGQAADTVEIVRAAAALKLALSDLIGLAPRRNLIINGAFEVDQRKAGGAYAATTIATYGCVDRWWMRQAGTAQCSFQQVPLTAGLVLQGFSKGLKCLLTGTSTGVISFGTILETIDVTKYQGQTITLIARAIKGSTWNPASVTAYITSGTGADQGLASFVAAGWTGQTDIMLNAFVPTAAFQKFLIGTVAVPAGCTELSLMYQATPTGAAVDANSFLVIAGVEIIDSPTATLPGWDRRPYTEELELCQRYYEKSFAQATAPVQNVGTAVGTAAFPAVTGGATTQRGPNFYYKQTKRTTPTITLFNPNAANGECRDSTAAADCSGTAVNINALDYFTINTVGNAATVANNRLTVHWTADAELV